MEDDDDGWEAAQPAIRALTKILLTAMNGMSAPVCAAALSQVHALLILQAPEGDQRMLVQAAHNSLSGLVLGEYAQH